ncbi:hypothetical protein [Brachybacterium saurashtrense]|nr:hypothetical protein [Brachybacterium saurashtrense]
MFTAILVALVVILSRLLLRRREAREQWEAAGRPEPTPRTPEERERDRRTALTWGCLVVAVPAVLMLAYAVTR